VTCTTKATVNENLSYWDKQAKKAKLSIWVKWKQGTSPCSTTVRRTVKIQAKTQNGSWVDLRTYQDRFGYVAADVGVAYKYRLVRAKVDRTVVPATATVGTTTYTKDTTPKYKVPKKPVTRSSALPRQHLLPR
jgi:hypothetical protein